RALDGQYTQFEYCIRRQSCTFAPQIPRQIVCSGTVASLVVNYPPFKNGKSNHAKQEQSSDLVTADDVAGQAVKSRRGTRLKRCVNVTSPTPNVTQRRWNAGSRSQLKKDRGQPLLRMINQTVIGPSVDCSHLAVAAGIA